MNAGIRFKLARIALLTVGLLPAHPGPLSPCDLTGDGIANIADVQAVLNQALGRATPTADLNGDGAVNVIDVQIEIDAALGLGCPTALSAITDFSPKSAPPGTLISVAGANFAPGLQVTLAAAGGGSLNPPLAALTANTFTFVVPPGAVTGKIATALNGQAATSAAVLTILPSASFSLGVSPATVTLLPGQSVAVAVSLSGNLSQIAALSVSGLANGITASFSPPNLTAGGLSSLTFTAPAGQPVGSSSITVSGQAVIDGNTVTRTAPVTLQVVALTTSFLGRTVVADPPETPLAGVHVSMLGKDGTGATTGCTGSAFSDAAGNFLLSNLPASCVGPQLVAFDGTTATSPPGKYAGVNLIFTLSLNQATASPVLAHLPRIDTQETFNVQQNAGTDQSYSYTTIPGLSLVVYAHTTFTMPDGTQPNPFPLVAVNVPVDRLPDLKPVVPTMLAVFIVAFQPANVTASRPVAVSYPNVLSTPPGTDMVLMTLDPTHGAMIPYGTGVVSPDGTQIVPDMDPAFPGARYGIVHFDWHGPMPPPPNQSNPNGPFSCSDPVDLATGIEFLKLRDVTVFGTLPPLVVDRTYRTMTSNAGPFGIGTSHNFNLQMVPLPTGAPTVYNFVVPDGNQYVFNSQSDGTFTNSSIPFLRGAVVSATSSGQTLRLKDGTVLTFQILSGFGAGQLTAISDPNGNVLTISHTATLPPLVTQVSDAFGRSLVFSYDSSNRIASITDPIGRTQTYTYNAQGTLASFTNAEGGVTQYIYDSNNRLTQVTDPRGVTTIQNTYDTNGRVVQQVLPNGGTVGYAYKLLNASAPVSPVMQTTVTDPLGNQTVYRFNPAGFLTDVTDSAGRTQSYQLASGSNLNMGTSGQSVCGVCGESNPLTTNITYDANGNMLSATDLSGATTRYTYDPISNKLLTVTDALGHTTTYKYDSRGNLLTATDTLGNTVRRTYGTNGLVTSIADPTGGITSFAYDAQGNLISSTDPLGNISRIRYDAASRPVQFTSPSGQRKVLTYDRMNRIVTRSAGGLVTTFGYDANGNPTTVTDPKGNTTTYAYDNGNRRISEKTPSGVLFTHTYDANDQLIESTDAQGLATQYTYDGRGLRTREEYSDGAMVTHLYDGNGRVLETDDSEAGTFQFAYDAMGRLTGAIAPQGSISYAYDALGRFTSRQVVGQPAVTYTYDAAGNVTGIATQGASATLAYDALGRRTSLVRSNSVRSSFAYDLAGRLLSATHTGPAGALDSRLFTYDADGRRTQHAAGNGATLAAASSSTSVDADDKLLSEAGTSYAYDANGNLTSKSSTAGVTSYTWDARNRLRSVVTPGGSRFSFQYAPGGDLVSRSSTSQGVTNSESYVTDNLRNLAYLARTDGLQMSFLTGDTDELFATSNPYRSGTGSATGFEWSLADDANTTYATVDAGGAIRGRISYDPYGLTSTTGTEYPAQYTGRLPAGAGLYYNRARFYDSADGRFLGRDPIGLSGGINVYEYAAADPVNRLDTTGLDSPNPSGRGTSVGAGLGFYYGLGGEFDTETLALNNCECQSFIVFGFGAGYGGFGHAGYVSRVSGAYDPSDYAGGSVSLAGNAGIVGAGASISALCYPFFGCNTNSQGNVDPSTSVSGGFSPGLGVAFTYKYAVAVGNPFKCPKTGGH